VNAKVPVRMAHSVHQRLLNLARASDRPFNELLQYYAMERFLYRLAHTGYGEALLLKGALLLRVWGLPSARPTMDIDLMGTKMFSPPELVAVVKESMSLVIDDGLIFHPETIAVEAIDQDADYQGWRLLFRANLGNARIHLQVDVGLGDVVVPAPVWIELPTQLDFPAPRLLAYTPESAIAEKFQAMVALEKVNSRMKDFYDLWALAQNLDFKGPLLQAAVRATFERRRTAVPERTPLALTPEFSDDPTKQVQWAAFVRRLSSRETIIDLPEAVDVIRDFMMPPVLALSAGKSFRADWRPGGPWVSGE